MNEEDKNQIVPNIQVISQSSNNELGQVTSTEPINKIELKGLTAYLLECVLTIFAVFSLPTIFFALAKPNNMFGGLNMLAYILYVGPLTTLIFIVISIFTWIFYRKNTIKNISIDKTHHLIRWPFITILVIGLFMVIINLGDLVGNFSRVLTLDWESLFVVAELVTMPLVFPLFIMIILLPILVTHNLKRQKLKYNDRVTHI